MAETTAQELLAQLHDMAIPVLFDETIHPKDRKDDLGLIKQSLRAFNKSLKHEIDLIKSQWDAADSYEAEQQRLHLAPYLALDSFLVRIERVLSELEHKGIPLKSPIEGSERLMGFFETGDWQILPIKEALIWMANQAKENIRAGKESIEAAEADIEDLKRRLKKLRLGIGSILFALGGVAQLFLAASYFTSQPALALLLGVGGVSLLLMPLFIRRRNKTIRRTLQKQLIDERDTIEQLRSVIASSQEALKDLRKEYEAVKQYSPSEPTLSDITLKHRV
jgi:hypothetical protein